MTAKNWQRCPIKMVTGWAAEWCNLYAAFDDNGIVTDFNDSEDILLFGHLRHQWHIDAGFYSNYGPNGTYVVKFLVGELSSGDAWNNGAVANFETEDPILMISCVENWMENPPV